MNDFLRKIIKGNGILPSEMCQQSFKQNFEDAVNVEWSTKENQYEAIFYKNEMEYIALFDLSGTLMEYSQNLPANHLPIAIKDTVISMGEIMSSLLKNKGNMLEYEVIIRDKGHNRYLIIFSDNGDVLEEKKL